MIVNEVCEVEHRLQLTNQHLIDFLWTALRKTLKLWRKIVVRCNYMFY